MIVLEGWSAASLWSARRSSAVIGPMICGTCAAVVIWFSAGNGVRLLAALPPAAVLACYALSRSKSADNPPIQLMLSSRGYLGVSSASHRAVLRLYRFVYAAIFLSCAFAVLSSVYRSFWVLFMIRLIPLLALCTVAALAWAVRRLLRRSRPTATLTHVDYSSFLVPWGFTQKVALESLRPGIWLVTISPRPQSGAQFIALEADISDDRMALITAKLASWRLKLAAPLAYRNSGRL